MASRVDAGNELNSAAALQYRKLCLKKHRCDLLKDKNRSPKSWSFAVAASSQTLVSSGAFLRQWKIWQHVFTLKKNVFLSVFFLLATNSHIWFSRSALSARPTIEPQLHSNVHWRKKKKKKSPVHAHYREERQERSSLGSTGPCWIDSSGSQRSACLLRCLESAQVVDMQGDGAAPQLACFRLN